MKTRQIISIFLCFLMIFGQIQPISAQSVPILPAVGSVVGLSQPINPILLRGLKIDPQNPFQFEFIVDPGDHHVGDGSHAVPNKGGHGDPPLHEESKKLVKYFLASLTIPEEDLWVNLSPHEPDRIVPKKFGQTDMGRDLLAQDYLLKQLSSSLLHPDGEVGKQFWERIYAKSFEEYGTVDIPVDTFHKIWIVPEQADLFEHDKAVVIEDSKLKVMLDEDYRDTSIAETHAEPVVAPKQEFWSEELEHKDTKTQDSREYEVESNKIRHSRAGGNLMRSYNDQREVFGKEGTKALGGDNLATSNQQLSTNLMKSIILPAVEQEVNEGAHFAQLRQIYHSLILATWFKTKFQQAILNQIYGDANKNVASRSLLVASKKENPATNNQQPTTVESIYNQYLQSFKQGVANFIREEVDPISGEEIPRKYFTGGVGLQVQDKFNYRTQSQYDASNDLAMTIDIQPEFKNDMAMKSGSKWDVVWANDYSPIRNQTDLGRSKGRRLSTSQTPSQNTDFAMVNQIGKLEIVYWSVSQLEKVADHYISLWLQRKSQQGFIRKTLGGILGLDTLERMADQMSNEIIEHHDFYEIWQALKLWRELQEKQLSIKNQDRWFLLDRVFAQVKKYSDRRLLIKGGGILPIVPTNLDFLDESRNQRMLRMVRQATKDINRLSKLMDRSHARMMKTLGKIQERVADITLKTEEIAGQISTLDESIHSAKNDLEEVANQLEPSTDSLQLPDSKKHYSSVYVEDQLLHHSFLQNTDSAMANSLEEYRESIGNSLSLLRHWVTEMEQFWIEHDFKKLVSELRRKIEEKQGIDRNIIEDIKSFSYVMEEIDRKMREMVHKDFDDGGIVKSYGDKLVYFRDQQTDVGYEAGSWINDDFGDKFSKMYRNVASYLQVIDLPGVDPGEELDIIDQTFEAWDEYLIFMKDVLDLKGIDFKKDREGFEHVAKPEGVYKSLLIPAARLFHPELFQGEDDHAMLAENFAELSRNGGGGKVEWSKFLDRLAEKLGFKRPGLHYFDIKDIWAKFYNHPRNKDAFKEMQSHVKYLAQNNKTLTDDDRENMKSWINELVFPPELVKEINQQVSHLKGKLIIRSSGAKEDQFNQNLAGLFISVEVDHPDQTANAIGEILKDALDKLLIDQFKKGEQHFNFMDSSWVISELDGFGFEVDEFLDFQTSGTAFSSYYRANVIQAVVGEAKLAVRLGDANAAQYIFEKDSDDFEFNPSYAKDPDSFMWQGNFFSRSTDKKAWKEKLAQYPKIGEALSPLTEEQAKELNRVLSLLEKEIAKELAKEFNLEYKDGETLPIDVEWGYKDGELYLIQVRPLVGDMTKDPVLPSENLLTKQMIAKTSNALGQTSSDGFTASVVMIGKGATKEEIKNFEAMYNQPYIRIQEEVASDLTEATDVTKARALVDPQLASNQAHNVNFITKRAASGEFAYANGPVLAKGILDGLTFVAHPIVGNIWIATQQATFFSSGLGAQLSVEPNLDHQRPNASDRETEESDEDRLYHMYDQFQSHWEQLQIEPLDEDEDARPKLKEFVRFVGLLNYKRLTAVQDSILEDLFSVSYLDVQEHVLDMISKGQIDLEDYLSLKKLSQDVSKIISLPVWPPRTRSLWAENLSKLGLLHELEDWIKKQEKDDDKNKLEILDESPPKLEKTKVLVLEDLRDAVEYIKDIIVDDLGKDNYEFVFASDFKSGVAVLDKQKFDVVIFDVVVPFEKFREEFFEKIQSAKSRILFSNASEGSQLQAKHNSTNYVDKTGKWIKNLKESLQDFREQQVQEHQRRVEEHNRQQQNKEPQFPKQLRILYVDDDHQSRKNIQYKFDDDFSDSGEYTLKVIGSIKEANEFLEKEGYDFVLFDAVTPSSDEDRESFFEFIKEIPFWLATSDAKPGEKKFDTYVPRDIQKDERFNYIDRYSYGTLSYLPKYQDKQIKNFEQQASSSQEKPEPPAKIKVLVIDDESGPRRKLVEQLKEAVGEKGLYF